MVHVFCNLEEDENGLLPMCDMTFEITEKVYDEVTSSWHLTLQADATPLASVGLATIIPASDWSEQVNGEGDEAFHSFWGPVTLLSTGLESDRLLALLADYYGVAPPKPATAGLLGRLLRARDGDFPGRWKFTQQIECLAVGIASNPSLIADEVVRMKLFFDEGIENGRYAEIFLNIDLPEGYAALNEKDEEYREDLIHWLSRPDAVVANPYHGS
jgi:hypothetical protein